MNIKVLAGDFDGDELIAHPIVNQILLAHKKDIEALQKRLMSELQQPVGFRPDNNYPIFHFTGEICSTSIGTMRTGSTSKSPKTTPPATS